MRILIVNLTAVALLVLSAGGASAFDIRMEIRGGLQPSYTSSDTVTVDVFLDAPDSGVTFLTVHIITDEDKLVYNAVNSAGLPIIYDAPDPLYGTTGALPGYILYANTATGMSFTVTALYPQQTPAWLNWPVPPEGKEVVNLNFAEKALTLTVATGNNIWIGSLVYNIIAADGVIELDLDELFGGTLSAFDGTNITELPVTLAGGPFVIVPEPALALLSMMAIATVAGLRRHRRSR